VIKIQKLRSEKNDLEKKMDENLQKWIHGHVQKCIKMFKWSCYKKGDKIQKQSHHQETQEFSLGLKYKLCVCDSIKRMVHDNIICVIIDSRVWISNEMKIHDCVYQKKSMVVFF
jgi:hypothetical protein